jgi:hypothetical protein
LVQPIRIDDFAVVSTGVSLADLPGALPAGAGVRHMMTVPGGSGMVRVSGKLWADPWTMDVPIDGAYTQKVGTLLFGDTVIQEVSGEDTRRLAFAARVVSPYTSYLAVEPGTQPSTQGLERGGGGGGTGTGTGVGYGVSGGGSGGGGVGLDLEGMLEDMLSRGARGCGALDPQAMASIEGDAALDIEATEREIVDVRLDGAPSAVIGTCLIEQAWTLALGSEYVGHVTYRANVSVI